MHDLFIKYKHIIFTFAILLLLGVGYIIVGRPPHNPIDPEPYPPIPSPTPFPTPVPQRSGTVGDTLPVIYEEWWLLPNDKYAVLPNLIEDAYYRTNVMFTWKGRVEFELQFISQNGEKLGSSYNDTYKIEPCASVEPCSGYAQLNQALRFVDKNYSGLYVIKVLPISGTGKLYPFATVIDNRSGDFITALPFRFAFNDDVWSASGLYYSNNR